MRKILIPTLASTIITVGCVSHPPLTSGKSGIRQIDEYIFYQKPPEAISLLGGVRKNSDEDRRAAVKEAAEHAKSRGCKLIALISPFSTPENVAERLRVNKIAWNESNEQERTKMVKINDSRIYQLRNTPEEAFGTGIDNKGNVWLCLKERMGNSTSKNLLVDPNDL